jgi:23S rRNA (pseudouridine1915-N3)-methyltransferase
VRLTILAMGRLRAGPERELVDDRLGRLERTGRPLGLGPAAEVEIEVGGGPAAEARALIARLPRGARLCALDERGRLLGSPAFAATLRDWAAEARDAAFAIGGAEGLDPAVMARADLVLSLGPMVWPHRLVRAMLAEQLYRAATILAGTPYHRD